jgi:RNA polymerase sigma-70 factor (ECF subfamily)
MFTTSLTLLARLRDPQDDGAWRQLVSLYTPLLRSWLRPHCAQESDAEDLTQEVLAVLVQKVREFAHNRRMGAFRTWLRSVAANKLADHLRRRQRPGAAQAGEDPSDVLAQLADPASGLSQVWERQHDEHVAASLLGLIRPEFTAPTWEAFQRLVVQGQSTAEVADALKMTRNAVLIAKSRVLGRLRQEIRAWQDE